MNRRTLMDMTLLWLQHGPVIDRYRHRFVWERLAKLLRRDMLLVQGRVNEADPGTVRWSSKQAVQAQRGLKQQQQALLKHLKNNRESTTSPYTKATLTELMANESLYCKFYITGFCNTVYNTRTEIWKVYQRSGMGLQDLYMQLAELLVDKLWVQELASQSKKDLQPDLQHPLQLPETLLAVCGFMGLDLATVVGFLIPHLQLPSQSQHKQETLYELGVVYPEFSQCCHTINSRADSTRFPYARLLDTDWLGFTVDVHSYNGYDCSAGVICQNEATDEIYGPRQTRIQALGMRMDMVKLVYEKYQYKVVPPLPHEFVYGLFSRTCRDLPLVVNLFTEYADFIKQLMRRSADCHTAVQFESMYRALTSNPLIREAATGDFDLAGNFELLRQLIVELNDIIVQGNAKRDVRPDDSDPCFLDDGHDDETIAAMVAQPTPEELYVPLNRKTRRRIPPDNSRLEDRSTGVRAVRVPQVPQDTIDRWFGRQQQYQNPQKMPDSDDEEYDDDDDDEEWEEEEEEDEEEELVEEEGQVHITPEYKTPTSADSNRMTPLIDNQRNLYPQDPAIDLPLWSRMLTEQIDPATGVMRDMAGKMCLPVTENQIQTACFAVLAHMTGSMGEDIASEESASSWEPPNQNPNEQCGVCGTSRYKVFNKRWRDIDQAFSQMMQAVMADDCTKSLYRKWQNNGGRCYVCRWIPFICDAVRDVMSFVFDFAVQERERLSKVTQVQDIAPNCLWMGLESRISALERSQKPMHAHFLQALYYFRNVDQILEHQCQRRWNAGDFVHIVVPPGQPFYSTDQHETMVRVRLDSASSYVISHQYAAESTVFALKSIASNLRRQYEHKISSVRIEMAEDGRSITMPQYLLDYIQVHYAPGCSTDAWKRGMPAAMHPDYKPPRSMHVPERLVRSEWNVKSQPLSYALQWPAALADWHADNDDRRVSRAVVWLKRLCDKIKGHYVGGDTLCFSPQVDLYRQLLDGLLNTLFPLGAVHMADAMLFHFRAEEQHSPPATIGNILTNPTEIISVYDLLWNFIHMRARFILFSRRMLCFMIDHLEAPGQKPYLTSDAKCLLLICHIILTRGRECSQSADWIRVANTTIEPEHRVNNPYVIQDLDKYHQQGELPLGYWFYYYCARLHSTRRDMSGARRSEVAREICQGMIPYDRRNLYSSVKPASLFISPMLRQDPCHMKHPVCSIRNKIQLYYQWTKFNGLLDNDEDKDTAPPYDRISMVGALFAIIETMALLPDAVPPGRSNKEEHGAVDVRQIRENDRRSAVLAALPGCPSKVVLKKKASVRTSEFEYYVPRGLFQPEMLLDLAVFEGSHVYDQPSPSSSQPPILASYNEEWTGVCFYPRDQVMPLWSSVIRPSYCDRSPANEHMLPFATMFAPFTNSHPQLLSRLLISQQSGDYFDLEQLMYNLRSHRLTRGFYSVMKPQNHPKGTQEPLVASRSFSAWMEKSWAYRWYDDDTLQTTAEADEMYQLVRHSKIDPSGSMTYLVTENWVQELRVSLSSSSSSPSPSDADNVFLDNNSNIVNNSP